MRCFFLFKKDVSGSSLPLTTAAAVLDEEGWDGHGLLASTKPTRAGLSSNPHAAGHGGSWL